MQIGKDEIIDAPPFQICSFDVLMIFHCTSLKMDPSHWVEAGWSRLTIALRGYTKDQHHIGLRQVGAGWITALWGDNSSMGGQQLYGGTTALWGDNSSMGGQQLYGCTHNLTLG